MLYDMLYLMLYVMLAGSKNAIDSTKSSESRALQFSSSSERGNGATVGGNAYQGT
jgi:hypothetical protein